MNFQFIDLLNKILPYYLLILLGFVAGRYLNVSKKSIADILLYLIIPAVFFDFGIKLKIEFSLFILPIIIFLISVSLNRFYLYLGKQIWPNDLRANIIAFSAGTANTGYFGLPVALMLFDDQTVAVYMLMNIGMTLYDYTLGAFTVARGKLSRNEAIINVFKMPILYAFLVVFLFHTMGFAIPHNFDTIVNYLTGTYAVLGMMIIGLGISNIKKFELDWKFIGILLSARFIAAPILIAILIQIDITWLNMFDKNIYLSALLISLMPPAANTVVFASLHNSHPEKAASAVIIGTVIALIYLPIMISLFF